MYEESQYDKMFREAKCQGYVNIITEFGNVIAAKLSEYERILQEIEDDKNKFLSITDVTGLEQHIRIKNIVCILFIDKVNAELLVDDERFNQARE